MSRHDIEARLDRSLEKQLGSRPLDASFNAAVWARIAAEEYVAPAAPRRAPAGSRWLLVSNLVGIVTSLALMAFFLGRSLTGVEVQTDVSLPSLSEQQWISVVNWMGWCATAAALGFAVAVTPLGRRLRNFLI